MGTFARAADIKVAVVGYGPSFNIARHHLNEMKRAGMTPVAVADIDPARLEAAAQEFPGIATYPSAKALLAASDAHLVSVCTPHDSHAPIALQCLRAGRHVVTEKPFAIDTRQCDRMIREAQARGLMLSAYHNRHWDGCITHAVNQLGTGMIGDILRIEAHLGQYGKPRDWWRSSKSISGGVMYDWGAHLLEYSLQLIRSDIVEVSGFAVNGYWAPHTIYKEDTTEDEATALVRFADGRRVSLTITRIDSNPKPGWLEITGSRGTYVFDGSTWYATVHEADGSVVYRDGKNPPSQSWRFYQNVADHLVADEPLIITPEWARRPIHIMDLAGRSARTGRTLRAKYQ